MRTGNKRSADYDVNIQTLSAKQLHLLFNELLRHLLSIATLTIPRLLEGHLQGLSAQGLKLLQCCRSGGRGKMQEIVCIQTVIISE